MLNDNYLISIFWWSIEMLQTAFLNDICQLSNFFFAANASDHVDLKVWHFE